MNEPFIVFQSFSDISLAQEVAEKLKQNNIPFEIEDTSSPIDPLIIGSGFDTDLRIKLQQGDFNKAHSVLEEYYADQIDTIGKDYYLYEFSDQELNEILEKPDEWGVLDYKLAQKILKERGKEVQPEKIKLLKAERVKEISRPEKVSGSGIFLGYLIAIFFSPIGILFGIAIASLKKTLPSGERVYTYNEKDRTHGRNIIIISSVLTIVWIYFKFLRQG